MFFLNFSDRRTGNCGSIAAFCAQMQGGRAVDIPEIFARGCGACQTECFQKDGVCPLPDAPAITALYEAITEQGACFIVPNYCDWPCSNFFRFCERGCDILAPVQNAPSAILPPKSILSLSAIRTAPISRKFFGTCSFRQLPAHSVSQRRCVSPREPAGRSCGG